MSAAEAEVNMKMPPFIDGSSPLEWDCFRKPGSLDLEDHLDQPQEIPACL
jgi:hypothetical protein